MIDVSLLIQMTQHQVGETLGNFPCGDTTPPVE